MISMRKRLSLMIALILLVTQLISALWLWHESQEQIGFLVDETLTAHARTELVNTEIAEAIASLLVPTLVMICITIVLTFWAISWIVRPLNLLQQRLATRSADNLSPLPVATGIREVADVTTSINQLFSRLSNAIEQERLFTADAAHELRTPLAGVRLHLELMQQAGIADAQFLVNRIDLLMHTIEQLLMLSRAGQNFASGVYQQFDIIEEVIAPLRDELKEMAAQREQTLHWLLPTHARIEGDAVLIRLLLRNLVENAHRYSPECSSIDIILMPLQEGILLQVRDRGPGIDEKMAGELTQAFRRMDQRYGGSGLGLNIVVRIAHLHQGKLTLINRTDHSGLNAQCWLPLAQRQR